MSPDSRAIRAARQKAGKTQREVAATVGVCMRTVIRWEMGQTSPSAYYLHRLALVLRRDPRDLQCV